MSLKTQSKVLRVLDENRVEPIGSNPPVKVDVRVIAATNKKLEEEIARNTFREDLFYRLNVIPFYVPALRERTEDIPIIASHFFWRSSAKSMGGSRRNLRRRRWKCCCSIRGREMCAS